jgi:hypothetical protein
MKYHYIVYFNLKRKVFVIEFNIYGYPGVVFLFILVRLFLTKSQ